MAKRNRLNSSNSSGSEKPISLPKDALSRINLGNSFAEYDKSLKNPYAFVKTPAMASALEGEWSKCFFVGRRGTGKTAITLYLEENNLRTITLHPQLLVPEDLRISLDDLRDVKRQAFSALKYCFWRALQDEVVSVWFKRGLVGIQNLKSALTRERNLIEEDDFNLRLLMLFDETYPENVAERVKGWVRQKNRTLEMAREMDALASNKQWNYVLLIDKIDEAWEGDDKAVIFLMGLMHACVDITATVKCFRPLMFLRENIFERVRQIDTEFARIDPTGVVSMDWTQEQLLELVERRLNLPFTTRIPLRGPTWDYFFEEVDGESSRTMVFNYCQERPRDVLIYCSSALEVAKTRLHTRVQIEDLQTARRQFSEQSLKELGDEYAENFPRISLVLSRFYGLGKEFTLSGIQAFLQKLLVDTEVAEACGSWFTHYSTPELFLELLYQIGFIGFAQNESVQYRSLGVRKATPPPITVGTRGVIHPSFVDALNLMDRVVDRLDDTVPLRSGGILDQLPEGNDLPSYQNKLMGMESLLKNLPRGRDHAAEFESIVGDILRLCFYKHFTNIQARERQFEGVVIRDWIVSNVATSGFWEMVRTRYQAIQVIWECKNFDDLNEHVFHQLVYYMNDTIGKFIVLVFRGERKKSYNRHLARIANNFRGMVLILEEADLLVLMRQARKGKDSDNHLRDIFDHTIHAIS